MTNRLRKFASIGVLLFIASSGLAQEAVLREGVQVNQPENNVEVVLNEDFNLSGLKAYNYSTELGDVNFSVNPSGSSDAIVMLSFFDGAPASEEKFAKFEASSNASEVGFQFSNLENLGVYDVYANNVFHRRPNATDSGSISFIYEDWSTNIFEIFRGATYPADNVSVTLKGDYSSVVADGVERTPGTFTDLEYPYIVMENDTNIEGIVATDGFKQASYGSNGRDKISLRKGFGRGRFLLPANTGSSRDLEERESSILNEEFLNSFSPSFSGRIDNTHELSTVLSYDRINLSGDEGVMDSGTNIELYLENRGERSIKIEME